MDPDPLPDPNPDPFVRGMDPRIQIRIRIHIKISWIRNTGFYMPGTGIPDGAVEGAVREAHPVDKDVDEVLALYEGTPYNSHLSARRLAHIRPHLHKSVNQSMPCSKLVAEATYSGVPVATSTLNINYFCLGFV
jgi:hypothetical protein